MARNRHWSFYARSLMAAWLLALAAPAALAQDVAEQATLAPDKGLGLKLTLRPSDFPLVATPTQPVRLDLTLRWDNLPTPAGPVSLFAGRTLGRLAPNMPGLVSPDPELRSASDLMYIGVQFDGGARLRLKRSGDGLKLSYRSSF